MHELVPRRAFYQGFLPRDAMHPRDEPRHVRPSVRLSQVGVLSKRLNESSWVLARELFDPSYTVLKGNSVISKIRALPSGTLS